MLTRPEQSRLGLADVLQLCEIIVICAPDEKSALRRLLKNQPSI
jgi:hypothetical protein